MERYLRKIKKGNAGFPAKPPIQTYEDFSKKVQFDSMDNQRTNGKSLEEMKNEYIGQQGTKERDDYEYELRMDLLGKMIKTARQKSNLTQEQLGELVGVNKSRIAKLENGTNSARIDTVLRVFQALEADIQFNVKLEEDLIELA